MKKHLPLLSLALLLTLPPLIGGWIAGEPLDHYFHFPTTGDALIDSPFSPALLSTRQWLASHPRLVAHLNRGRPIPAPNGEVTVALLLIFGLASLLGLASWPQWLHPTLWLAPLALLTAWQLLLGRQTIFSNIARGDWSRVVLAALAGLLCGLFWELWNWGALAQWHYNLPHIDRYRLFEMPLLGWAGYLPFGLLCVAAADLLAAPWRGNPRRPARPKPFPVKIVLG